MPIFPDVYRRKQTTTPGLSLPAESQDDFLVVKKKGIPEVKGITIPDPDIFRFDLMMGMFPGLDKG